MFRPKKIKKPFTKYEGFLAITLFHREYTLTPQLSRDNVQSPVLSMQGRKSDHQQEPKIRYREHLTWYSTYSDG